MALKQIAATLPTSQDAMPLPVLASAKNPPACPPERASQKAALLFGCYRKGDAADPEIYVAAVTAILSEYPAEVVDFVCDPRTGLPRKLSFLPTVAEIAAACDARMEYAEAIAKLHKRAEKERAIVANPNASAIEKLRAQEWLDRCAPKEGK